MWIVGKPHQSFPVFLSFLGLGLILLGIGCSSKDSDVTNPSPPGQTLGPAGGTLTSGDSRAHLVIPPGALSQDTSLRLDTIDLSSWPTGLVSDRVYGLNIPSSQFSEEVTLVITYDPGDVPGGVAEDDLLMYQYQNDSWTEVPDCVVDTLTHAISGSFGGSDKTQDWCVDSFGFGRIIPSVLAPGSTTAFITTSELATNDCFSVPTYPLQTQYVTISEDGNTVTFMGITGNWDISAGSGDLTQDIPVDIQNECWCHQTLHFSLFFSDQNHFTGTYRVHSDYTSTCEADDCTYQFNLTGVHQE